MNAESNCILADVAYTPAGAGQIWRQTLSLASTSGVLGGIRGYTAYTNLRVFFDNVYSPQWS